MIGIQILALLFVLWMTYFSYLHYRRGEFTVYEFAFWQVLWVGLTVVVFYPRALNGILRTFSISRAFDLVVVVGIVILFGVTFRNYVLLKRMKRKIEDMIRQQALREK